MSTLFIAYRIQRCIILQQGNHPLPSFCTGTNSASSLRTVSESPDADVGEENNSQVPGHLGSTEEFGRDPERSLSSWVASALRLGMPGKHQATIARIQPRLRKWTKIARDWEDLLWGRSTRSPLLVRVLCALALVQLWPIGPRVWMLLWLIFWFVRFTSLWRHAGGFVSWHRHVRRSRLASAEELFDHIGDRCPDSWCSPESLRLEFATLANASGRPGANQR